MEIGISQYNSPSFSSSLLDAIYRSIGPNDDEMLIYEETDRKRLNQACRSEEEMANFRRACMIEKWMEKKTREKTAARGSFAADLQMKKPRKLDRTPESSSWSSSDSGGSGGGLFSSESESFPFPRPKPVRTSLGKKDSESSCRGPDPKAKLSEGGGSFLKTKSRALKIYGDLKKAKQPISPGGKLAGFLNSLFPGSGKQKTASAGRGDHSPSPKSTNTSTCSSASSLSRSCLSKTTSSRSKPSSGAKRSVRFSPVGVTADKDFHKSTPENKSYAKRGSIFEAAVATKIHDGHKTIKNVIHEELMAHIMEKNRHVEEVARDLLKRKIQASEFPLNNLRKTLVQNQPFDRDLENDDDDDVASCASSDLFELDNLSAIGMERYSEELPVYETTHIDRMNRASTNGLIF